MFYIIFFSSLLVLLSGCTTSNSTLNIKDIEKKQPWQFLNADGTKRLTYENYIELGQIKEQGINQLQFNRVAQETINAQSQEISELQTKIHYLEKRAKSQEEFNRYSLNAHTQTAKEIKKLRDNFISVNPPKEEDK